MLELSSELRDLRRQFHEEYGLACAVETAADLYELQPLVGVRWNPDDFDLADPLIGRSR